MLQEYPGSSRLLFNELMKSLAGRNILSILKQMLVYTLWIFAGWMLLWNIFRIWPGERLWLVALVNYFTPWFGLLLIPLIFLTLFLKERVLLIVLLVAFLLIAGQYLPNFIPKKLTRSSAHDIKVMTFNVHQRNMDSSALVEIIMKEDADIIALQEIPPEVRIQLAKDVASQYPYNTLELFPGLLGQGLLSRYPLGQVSEKPDYSYQSAVIQTNQGPLKIINVHAPTLFPSSWKKDWLEQREYYETLVAEVRSFEGPLILAGDFNTTPQSENYALVASDLKDTFQKSGWGFGFTYPAKPKFGIELPTPLVRIDYIFVNEYFESTGTRVIDENGGSDHHPVSSYIRIVE
jgi:endonuclease/exonuclease/phosphatase (EEP) superfamily protein YafD